MLCIALAACIAAVPRTRELQLAAGIFVQATTAYLPGSSIPLRVEGISSEYKVRFIGQGAIRGSNFAIPLLAQPGVTTVLAYNNLGIAQHDLRIAAAPSASASLLAVASYDTGIALHDARTFAPLGTLAIGGAPSDVAIDRAGRIGTGDTTASGVTIATLAPWDVASIPNVPVVDEVAFDSKTQAFFATNRSLESGLGALTRVLPDGSTSQLTLGITAEGIVVDAQRRRVYVANVNEGTVSIVDADAMREVARVRAVDRAFGLALSPDGKSLYVVSNQGVTSPFGAAGSVVRVALDGDRARVVQRSGRLSFPVSVALDARANRIFVTDEHDDDVYVMNATTLRETHQPLQTCRTPWKPLYDAQSDRLYVPCARADRIDVFDARTLRRVHGAPFATGGYPLSVAIWHPRPT